VLPTTETACFAIADISGYTRFVSGVELDHAQDIIADIMDTLVRALRPPFRVAKFEGDAAFVYAPTDKVDGALLQDCIEQAYFAFRKRLRNIAQASACECEACRQMPGLDVKFVVHHGEFIRQRMGGREELAGREVILVHRLLKNDVVKTFGAHAYVLYSDACLRAFGVDPVAQGLAEIAEPIEHLGEVRCWVRDLENAWTDQLAARRVVIERADAIQVIAADLPAPRAAVWDWLTQPGRRPRWQDKDSVTETHAKGRRGAGTRNHCLHGKETIVEDVVDWRPFDHWTITTLLPAPGAPRIPMCWTLEATPDGGTHLELRFGKLKGKDLAFFESIWPGVHKKFTGEIEGLRGVLAQTAPPDEAPLPVLPERFPTHPVREA
jgi:hypothetical protein